MGRINKAYLKTGHSPEQLAGILARVHSDTPSLRVSHETIYTAIYALPRGALRTQVIGWLYGTAMPSASHGREDRIDGVISRT